MKLFLNYLLFFGVFFISCRSKSDQLKTIALNKGQETPAIVSDIFNNRDSFYYIDFLNYGKPDSSLPIGIFDSGTGGLTVLDAIIRFDQNINFGKEKKSDGLSDFKNEEFVYLADQANMPYGNYFSENKSDLLIEHIIKDTQFLLAEKYYQRLSDSVAKKDKKPVKAIVIACNTATAYGQDYVNDFIAKTGIDIPVIGVISAGSRGALATFGKQESGAIGVFATVGTIKSKGYENSITKLKEELGYTGDIQIYSQGGYGVAEAVDEEPDFIARSSRIPRENYRGPSLNSSQFKIEKMLMDVYNFDFAHYKMLCDVKDKGDCQILQINSTDNYVRYHLVSLMEKIRANKKPLPLKVLLLGCTHYPYLVKEIKSVLYDLYNYKHEGKYIYRHLMAQEVVLIDPSEFVAQELYDTLNKKQLLNDRGSLTNSEFYISVPNTDNKLTKIDSNGRFIYEYKYGRSAGEIQEYVKVVPFSRENISDEVTSRIKSSIPRTFELIKSFSNTNNKVRDILQYESIK